MAQSKDNYQLLIEKLDQFTRKYYLNQLIRGTLYAVGLILLLFIVVNVLEYFFYFSKPVRKSMFFSFIGTSITALVYWVFLPLMRYFRLGKLISHRQAAEIIGKHFTNVKDKLLNVLQLREQADQQATSRELILASVNQKSEEIKPVPFPKAINLGQNRKYLRYAIPPLLLLLILLLAAPSVIKDGTKRLINNNKDFEREAPFQFLVDAQTLKVVQYEDFDLNVDVEGEMLPNEAFINIDNYQYRLNKEDQSKFSYTFKNVNEDIDFYLFSSGFNSVPYKLEVLEKPNILGFEVDLDYPSYTGRKDENLKNIGDLVVPAGTNIDWLLNTENTDDIQLKFSGKNDLEEVKQIAQGTFNFKKQALKDESYKLFISNDQLPTADSIAYTLTVQPDLYPTISVEKFVDSTNTKLHYFVGDASDDYGLAGLYFNYSILKPDGKQGDPQRTLVQKNSNKQIQYDFQWDVATLSLEPGDQITYFFEVFDNDAINGSKSARTNIMTYAKPTVEEYEEQADQNDEEIKDELKKALEESRDIQEEMKKLREKMLQEKDLDWQNREELEKMLERQKELEKKIDKAKQKFEENMKNQEEFEQPEEEILEKQEQLQEMFEELMSEEMKELMEQIEELLQELEKDEALEMMEEMEMSDEELEMEMDRMLELFKQLEMEKELQEQIDKLNELAEKQEELSEQTKNEEMDQEELKEKQDEINKEFEDIKEKQEELREKNEELESPKEMGDESEEKEEMEDIQEDLNDSKENLDQQQNQKASDSQKNAAQKMKEMADKMDSAMQAGEMEQMQEDMEALRQLLENLVGLSFDQEDLIEEFEESDPYTPHYTGLVQGQFKLEDDFKLIEDSLQALSKRVFQIESYITEKVTEIKSNMRETLEQLEERKKAPAAEHQQRVMKNVNDLALMLSETMNQMQQQMAGMMAGSQMCKNPGGAKPNDKGSKPGDKISQGQESLNQQMQGLKKQLQKGKGKPGSMSKEFAQMAARQAALRKALKEKQQQMQKNGENSTELQELLDQMDQTETDLVNKRLTNEMMKRQQDILTRLLEAERAERQREFDNKRKSETGDQRERKLPPSLEEYLKKRQAQVDYYKQVSPSLKPFYKLLVEEYYKSLKTD